MWALQGDGARETEGWVNIVCREFGGEEIERDRVVNGLRKVWRERGWIEVVNLVDRQLVGS